MTRELWDCSHIKCDIGFQGNVIYSLCVERQDRFVKGRTAAESTQHLKKSESKNASTTLFLLLLFLSSCTDKQVWIITFRRKDDPCQYEAKHSEENLSHPRLFFSSLYWLNGSAPVSFRSDVLLLQSARLTRTPPVNLSACAHWNSERLRQDAAEASSGCTSVCSFESSETVKASACATSQTGDKSRQASHLIRSTIIQLWRLMKTWCVSSLNFFERGKKQSHCEFSRGRIFKCLKCVVA